MTYNPGMGSRTRGRPPIPINREILRWARERRKISVEEAARKVGTSPRVVDAWEKGTGVPSVRQARLLADYYGRGFTEFFRDVPPPAADVALVPDFRQHRHVSGSKEEIVLRDVQAWAEEIRLNALDLLEELDDEPPALPVELTKMRGLHPETAAAAVRKLIGPSISDQYDLGARRYEFVKRLRRAFENAGILVLRSVELGQVKARGLCFFTQPLPVIVFTNESPAAQAFTLCHELGHVVRGVSAISGPPASGPPLSTEATIEQWCNRFAAAYLVPANHLEASLPRPPEPSNRISDADLVRLANKYAVSPHAMLIRLVELGYIRPEFYWTEKREEFLQREQDYKGGGRAEYYGSRYRARHGDYYTSLVLGAWGSGRITGHSAAEFMGIKDIRHLEDVRKHFEP